MIIRVKKSYGHAFINLVRQLLIADTREYRPVAFKIGNASNVLAISDAVEEDMTEAISKFCAGNFTATSESAYTRVCLQCANTLRLSSVKNDDLVFAGTDAAVLHSFSPIEVEVIFRYGTGNYSADENEAFLQENGVDISEYVCVCSRHCLVENFSYTVTEEDDEVLYDVSIKCKPGVTEKALLDGVADTLADMISNLK